MQHILRIKIINLPNFNYILYYLKVFICPLFGFFMDLIKNAFQKVRQDMDFLYSEIDSLKLILDKNHEKINEIHEIIKNFNEKREDFSKINKINTSTDNSKILTTPTNSSTHNYLLEGLNNQNMPFSTGNQGVSTDRQTDRQTDTSQKISYENKEIEGNFIDNAIEILDSLDNIKKQIRLKFKRLTDQEWLVFSTIYQLEEENGFADYKSISEKINLTESSVRDYVSRIIKKGISVEKKKLNNKNIQLIISNNLKKIASLPTILQLRDL